MRWLRVSCLCSLMMFAGLRPPARAAERPNVLFINVDDMNWDSVGAYGCPVDDITPNIDRLASQGMRFEYAHVTVAICQPTRAVWMTGRYPHRNGALGFDPISEGVPTLLETLHEAGYYTGIMAKVPHVVPTRKQAWDMIVEAQELGVGRDPGKYAAHAKKFFSQAKRAQQPFFLMANSQDPHRPFAGSRQELDREKGTRRRKPSNFPQVRRVYQPEEIVVPGFLPDIPKVREELAEYFTSVHRADEIVGALLKELEAADLVDTTLVMFLSDHGMPLPFAKTNCYYNSTRTPWIVRWPDVVEPGRFDREHMISGIDLAPTVLDAVGLPNLEGADGRSFVPVLRGESQSGRDYVITHINRTSGKNEYPMRSVVTREFGYIWNGWSDGSTVFKNESQNGLTMDAMRAAAAHDPQIAARVELFLHRVPEELYDYRSDTPARHNLIDDPASAEQRGRLRGILLEHMQNTDDPQLSAFLKSVPAAE